MARRHIPLLSAPVHISKFMCYDLMRTGVYFLYHRDELVYVGQTRTLKWRLETHLAEGKKIFDAVGFIPCTVDRLTEIEGYYIAKYAPKYNNCGIAKAARERMSWRPAPLPVRDDMETIDASEVIFNSYEAADFLDVSEVELMGWRKAGLLPDLTLIACLNFVPHLRHIARAA